jgi:hypothetical protein
VSVFGIDVCSTEDWMEYTKVSPEFVYSPDVHEWLCPFNIVNE